MSNQITIIYNNIDLFSGIGPTPFVSSSQDFINFNTGWNQITNLTLEGSLTGKYIGTYSNQYINESFKTLLSRLSQNYGSLIIKDSSNVLISGQSVIIDSINIEDSNWYGLLPYSINIRIYETGLFKNYFGVTEPTESLNFTEEDNQILSLTHSISAKGLKIDSNDAIKNAKNWVKSRTGNYNKIIPILIKNTGSNFLLKNVSEQVDRFNGTYSWEGSYVKSIYSESPINSILNYTSDISSGIEDGFINVNINGSLENNNIQNLRSDYSGINFYNLANTLSQNIFNVLLNTKPINKSVTENENENKLNFNISYNNDFYPNIINDYTVSIEEDSIKLFNTVNLRATIKARYGDISTRWLEVQNFYKNNFSPYSLAKTEYNKEISNKTLFAEPLSESVTFNEYNAEIVYNATWSDKRRPSSNNVLTMRSSITYIPSIFIHVPNTSAYKSRDHNIQNLKCSNKSKVQISVSLTMKPNGSITQGRSLANTEISRLLSNYGVNNNRLREESSETVNEEMKIITVNETWGFDGPILS